MNYFFRPPIFSESIQGIVKRVEDNSHYSTHLPPFDFEINESSDMFICGNEYVIDENKALNLFNSGYGLYLDPPYNIE